MIKIFRSPALNAAYYDITSQTDGVRAGDATTFGFSRYRHATVGATEYYKIAAFYPSGVMESDPIAATIPLGPVGPTNIRAESPAKTDRYISSGQGSVWITWTCDPEATSYSAMKGKTGSGVEWIMDSRGFPLKIYGCAMLDIFWPGAIPIWDYKIVGNYNDPDTSSEGWVTVPIIKQP
jgi:hypothetical protein